MSIRFAFLIVLLLGTFALSQDFPTLSFPPPEAEGSGSGGSSFAIPEVNRLYCGAEAASFGVGSGEHCFVLATSFSFGLMPTGVFKDFFVSLPVQINGANGNSGYLRILIAHDANNSKDQQAIVHTAFATHATMSIIFKTPASVNENVMYGFYYTPAEYLGIEAR